MEFQSSTSRDSAKTHVSLILSDWIIKLMFTVVYYLSPVFSILTTHYPTFVAFSLNNENAIRRHDNMVNLSCVTIALKQKIIKFDIFIRQFQ